MPKKTYLSLKKVNQYIFGENTEDTPSMLYRVELMMIKATLKDVERVCIPEINSHKAVKQFLAKDDGATENQPTFEEKCSLVFIYSLFHFNQESIVKMLNENNAFENLNVIKRLITLHPKLVAYSRTGIKTPINWVSWVASHLEFTTEELRNILSKANDFIKLNETIDLLVPSNCLAGYDEKKVLKEPSPSPIKRNASDTSILPVQKEQCFEKEQVPHSSTEAVASDAQTEEEIKEEETSLDSSSLGELPDYRMDLITDEVLEETLSLYEGEALNLMVQPIEENDSMWGASFFQGSKAMHALFSSSQQQTNSLEKETGTGYNCSF